MFSTGLYHFIFPPAVHKGSNLFTFLITLVVFCVFSLIVAILVSVKLYLIVVLICIYLKTSRGATTCPRSGVAAERNNPTSKEWWLHGRRRAERRYSMFKVRRSNCEEIPLVQGKEQRLHFAGAAVKRYPTSKVRETQVRW